MRRRYLLVCVLVLAGCQPKSEIDKCMDALWEYHTVAREEGIKSGLFKKDPLPKEFDLQLKLEHRFKCLKAQAGK